MSTSILCIGGPLDGNSFTPGGERRPCPLGYHLEEFQGMQFAVVDGMLPLMARREMRRLYAEHRQSIHCYAEEANLIVLRAEAERLVDIAQRAGVVLTITQCPLQPLGMSNYETVVEVRPVQVPK